MTQDEIIEMAMEANFVSQGNPSREESELFVCTDKDIGHFAALVAAKAIAELESQEPVAWMYVNTDGECEQIEYGEPFDDPSTTPLYTHPPQRTEQEPQIAFNAEVVGYVAPQRTWVGLTRMELIKCGVLPFGMSHELYEAIEAKLKEKNT